MAYPPHSTEKRANANGAHNPIHRGSYLATGLRQEEHSHFGISQSGMVEDLEASHKHNLRVQPGGLEEQARKESNPPRPVGNGRTQISATIQGRPSEDAHLDYEILVHLQ